MRRTKRFESTFFRIFLTLVTIKPVEEALLCVTLWITLAIIVQGLTLQLARAILPRVILSRCTVTTVKIAAYDVAIPITLAITSQLDTVVKLTHVFFDNLQLVTLFTLPRFFTVARAIGLETVCIVTNLSTSVDNIFVFATIAIECPLISRPH